MIETIVLSYLPKLIESSLIQTTGLHFTEEIPKKYAVRYFSASIPMVSNDDCRSEQEHATETTINAIKISLEMCKLNLMEQKTRVGQVPRPDN